MTDVIAVVVVDFGYGRGGIICNAGEERKEEVDDVSTEILEGDPRYVLCGAVESHRASMLVLGSHGYKALQRAVLGSVSDYCAHHAHCSVMIVKKPKSKH
ncbi:hypothetical protein RDABS01_035664 [Bienertia sinuspersici]